MDFPASIDEADMTVTPQERAMVRQAIGQVNVVLHDLMEQARTLYRETDAVERYGMSRAEFITMYVNAAVNMLPR